MEDARAVMAGTLYLCATPIGNLRDITERVADTLAKVDLIAAEDTRNTLKLLNHLGIGTELTSYHEHNKSEKGATLLEKLKSGADVALVTDAGMPGISDPGADLVRICREAGITVTALPGASACVTAVALSGFSEGRFVFEGFLPAENKDRRERLAELAREIRLIVLYEAPHRLTKTLNELYNALGDRRAVICRELTKVHETVRSTTLKEAINYYGQHEARGEFVLVVEGRRPEEIREEEARRWEDVPVAEHMALYEAEGLDKKEAMKRVARDRTVPKRKIYDLLTGK